LRSAPSGLQIKTADWIIDLGPEAWPGLDPGASDGGGEIVAAGTPEDISAEKRSYTGAFLKPVLARRRGGAREEEAG
jgi:excinuclease ABC subunit A